MMLISYSGVCCSCSPWSHSPMCSCSSLPFSSAPRRLPFSPSASIRAVNEEVASAAGPQGRMTARWGYGQQPAHWNTPPASSSKPSSCTSTSLHSSMQQVDIALERAYCKCFKMFRRYVTSVSYECYKTRLKCCLSCNGCIHMLQASVLNVSSIFSDVCLQVCLFRCCMCFI
jgi:hypothetical protein